MIESLRDTISTIGRSSLRFDYDLSRSCVSFDPDKFLTALHAAGYTIEQAWQPIETAPKETGWVLLWCWRRGAREMIACWIGPDWGETFEVLTRDGLLPTHYRPLPTPPADAKDPP